MSLRARLLATTLALFTLGLAVAGFATYGFLRDFLLKRVDQQLLSVHSDVERVLRDHAVQAGLVGSSDADLRFGRPPFRGDRGGIAVPFGTYAELRDPNGQKLDAISFGRLQDDTTPVRPVLPTTVPVGNDAAPATFTVRVEGHSSQHFRALSEPVGNGLIGVVAIPMQDADQTLHRLIGVELAVAFAVLAAIAVSSLLLIRRGLRPLDRMGATAGAIAAGDLSQRVDTADEHTEIGRLGSALNAMLSQIEASFEERRAIEERLRQFIADASHELRTPLTSIRGWAELFRRGAASRPDDLERAMRRIEDESTRMTALVEDMLALARLDEGVPLIREPVDLSKLAADAVDDARAVEPGRVITFEPAAGAVVVGDSTRLQQILANLLANARHHTPAATPVHVRVAVDAGAVSVEVADEGPGMPADQAARIFERFYRADPSRTTSTGGAGLGLAIVAAVAGAHGGTATVDTAPGAGAKFTITIPTGPEPSAPPAAGPEAEEAAPDAVWSRSGH